MTYQMSLAVSLKISTSASSPDASQLNRSPTSTRVPSSAAPVCSASARGAARARRAVAGGVGAELRLVYAWLRARLDAATPWRACGDVPAGTKSRVVPSLLTIFAACRLWVVVYFELRCHAASIVLMGIWFCDATETW